MRVRVKGSRSIVGFIVNRVFVNGKAVELPQVPQKVLDYLGATNRGGRLAAPMDFLHLAQATLKNGSSANRFFATCRGGFIYVHFKL